jgi:mono/diheme cytochrome c family protein
MRRLALLLPIAVLAAACVDGTVTTPTPGKVSGYTAPTTTTPQGDATAGKAVFTSAGCVTCHTLADAGATGSIGPNLDNAKPDAALVVDRVTHGKGQMPSFKGTLTDKQIADVAAYVSAATHG